jgi:predicted Zn-dependent protease
LQVDPEMPLFDRMAAQATFPEPTMSPSQQLHAQPAPSPWPIVGVVGLMGLFGLAILLGGIWFIARSTTDDARDKFVEEKDKILAESPDKIVNQIDQVFGGLIEVGEETKDVLAKEAGGTIDRSVNLSLEDQRELGELWFGQLTQHCRHIEDPAVLRRVSSALERILTATPIAFKPARLAVLDDPTINACAIVGGHFCVYRGLLDAIGDDDEQLLFVLAHEVAHERLGHTRTSAAQVVLASQLPLGDIAVQQLRFAYSELQEYEADAGACEALWKLGIDRDAGVRLMRTLAGAHTEKPESTERGNATAEAILGAVDRHFATHPEETDRIARIKAWKATAKR